jgi:hypothetical protein
MTDSAKQMCHPGADSAGFRYGMLILAGAVALAGVIYGGSAVWTRVTTPVPLPDTGLNHKILQVIAEDAPTGLGGIWLRTDTLDYRDRSDSGDDRKYVRCAFDTTGRDGKLAGGDDVALDPYYDADFEINAQRRRDGSWILYRASIDTTRTSLQDFQQRLDACIGEEQAFAKKAADAVAVQDKTQASWK